MSHSNMRPFAAILAAIAALLGTACGSDAGGDEPAAPVVATFELPGGETYKIEMATPQLAEHARDLLAGKEVAAIPNGLIVRDSTEVNAPWSWHIDPTSLEFADMTTEVCDGLPSYVEDRTLTSDRYCPWMAKVIAVEG